MGGSTTTTESSGTSNQINQIPQWMSSAGQQNYALAQNVAEQPLQQYQGQTIADISPQNQQSWNVAANSGNVGADQYNAATAGYLNALNTPVNNITATQGALAAPVTANTGGKAATSALAQSALAAPMSASTSNLSQLSNTNLNPYLNPYTQDVINKTLPIMQQGLAQSQNQQQNAANSANAYGGSRQGIQQGVTQAQGALAQEQMAAQLNQANFAQAQQAGEYDVTAANNMGQFNAGQTQQAALNNMNAANNMNQFNTTAANNMGQFNAGALNNMAQFGATAQNAANLANMGAANNMSQFNASAQNTAAQQNQAAQQARIASNIQASQGLGNTGTQMNAANTANFNMLQSAGAGEQMQAQNQINSQIAKFNQAFNYPQQQLGVLEGSLGMTPHDTSTSGQTQNQSATTTPTDWSGIIENGAKSAASLYQMSDRRAKKDIEKVGQHPAGVPLYSFRYKGDDAASPKVLGPMAQDVQKKVPEAVGKVSGSGGMLAVHMPTLDAAAAKPQHFAAGAAFVGQPSLATFTPPSSPGVAKGISAMSAFRPQTRMPRGYGVPKMQKFADGSADVQPGPTVTYPTGQSQQLMVGPPQYAPLTAEQRQASPDHMGPMYSRTAGRAILNDPRAAPLADPRTFPAWKQYAGGAAVVPGQGMGDTVPAMLTPGEAVLTRGAAQQMGRGKIAALNAQAPPRGMAGALAGRRPPIRIRGALSA